MATLARVVLAIVVAAPIAAAQDVQPKFVLTGHRGRVWAVAFSPDGKRLATTGFSDRTLRFWDTASGAALKVKLFAKHTDPGDLAFTPDGKALVISYSFPVPRPPAPNEPGIEAVEILDLGTGADQVILQVEDPENLTGFRFSPDGRTLAMVTVARGEERNDRRGDYLWDGQIYLWDVGAKKIKARITSREVPLWHDIQFSPNGSTFATVWEHDILLWDTATWRVRSALRDPKWFPASLSFFPNGKWLAAADDDKDVRIWNLTDNTLSLTVGGFRHVGRPTYSPDGALLVVACRDGTLHVLDTANYARRATITTHSGPIWAVAFSPDGKFIATGATDEKVKLWETATFVRLLETQKVQGKGKRAEAPTDSPRPGPSAHRSRARLEQGAPLSAKEIRARLDRPASLKSLNGVSLERFIAEVGRATRRPGDSGVPVYVDPIGLMTTDSTMSSKVTIDADLFPMKQVLWRVLGPLGLDYQIADGVLVISQPDEFEDDLAGAPADVRDTTPKTKAALAVLARAVTLDYPDPTPLEDVLADIRAATRGPDGADLPIRVSAKGLENAEKTMASPITIALKGVPLRMSLRLLLAQLGMGYYVEDGALVITDLETVEADRH